MCKYCDCNKYGEVWSKLAEIHDGDTFVVLNNKEDENGLCYIKEFELSIVDMNSDEYDSITIHYCPVCGKKLVK